MSVQYYNLKLAGLDDFKNVILPDVFDELRFENILDMPGIICVGAADAVGPVGAIIVNLGENSEAEIASLYVDQSFRGKGVGRGLVSQALNQMLATLEENSNIVDPNLGIKLHIDFNLPEQDYAGFKTFLSKTGFSMQADLGESYLLDANCLENELLQNAKNADVKAISEYAGDDSWDDMAGMSGMELKPESCFFTGSDENPKAILLTQYGYAGDYYFITNAFTDDSAEADKALTVMLAKALSQLKKENPNFSVIANSEFNIDSTIWKQLADQAHIALHGEAVMPAVFLSKGGNVNA